MCAPHADAPHHAPKPVLFAETALTAPQPSGARPATGTCISVSQRDPLRPPPPPLRRPSAAALLPRTRRKLLNR